MFKKIRQFFMHAEWNISLWQLLFGTGGLVASFALPAWAINATETFAEYSPASWVAAGFAGLLLFTTAYALFAWASSKRMRLKYDSNLYERSGFVDPMASTFENKRIFLSDFALPSDPYIYGKTFINCEIVGPANLFLRGNYQVHEQLSPNCDAVMLNGDKLFLNGIIIDDCSFRKCSFRRITIMMLPEEYEIYRGLDWLNWISRPTDDEIRLKLDKDPKPGVAAPQLPQDIEQKKQP